MENAFFGLLGALLALYVVSCVVKGKVTVRAGLGSRSYERRSRPSMFWLSVGIYSLLAVALFTVF